MTKLFLGYLFIFLNCNITLDPQVINLLPGWLGYILILLGAAELAHESDAFVRLRPLGIAATVFSVVLWVLDAVGLSVSLGWFGTLLNLVGLILSLMVSYQTVNGILDMEHRWGDLGGAVLKRRWEVLAVMQCLSYLTVVFPLLALIFTIAALVFIVLFIVSVFRAQKLYNERKEQPPL